MKGVFGWLKVTFVKQCEEQEVDILIPKNQALQILYLNIVYIKQHNLNYHG